MTPVVVVINAFPPMWRAAGAARIVNVSSELGSARLMSDPDGPFSALNNAAYQSSKSALHMLTLLTAYAAYVAHAEVLDC